jgi:hypothetical protein
MSTSRARSHSQASILPGLAMYTQFQTGFHGLAEQPMIPLETHHTQATHLIGRPILFESGQFAASGAIRAELREIQQARLARK